MEYYLTGLVVSLGIYIILGTSFNLLFGYGGLMSIAHAAFFGIGAYTTGILTIQGVDFLVASVIGIALALLVSLLLSIPTLKVSGDYLFLATLGFQVMITGLFSNLGFLTGGPMGLIGIPRPKIFGFEFTSIYMVLLLTAVVAALSIYVVRRSIKSPFGLILESVREDEVSGYSLGKNTVRIKIEVFAFTAGLAAAAGSLYAGYLQYISPTEFSLTKSISILSLTIIGGVQTLWGPVLGAAFMVAIPQILSFIDMPVAISSLITGLVYSVLVIGFLIYRPSGLLGKSRNTKHKVNVNVETEQIPQVTISSKALKAAMGLIQKPQNSNENYPVLEVEGLHKEFGGLKAVQNLSFKVEKGVCIGLIGPNGAGKTTVFNLVTGVIKHDQGIVKFKGENISRLNPHERARKGIVRSFQEMRLFKNMSVIDNVTVGASSTKIENLVRSIVGGPQLRNEMTLCRERAMSMIEFFGLKEKADITVHELAYAEQKLVMMARLLATGADCLLLDEPCSGLDQNSRRIIIDTIRELVKMGVSIVLIEHNLDVLREVCSRVVFLDQGKCIMEGTMKEVTTSEDLGALYFGT